MPPEILGKSGEFNRLNTPLFLENVCAGFGNPAQGFIDQALDLNEYCIRRPASTFFVRVGGDSMSGMGIYSDDILIVDRSLQADHKNILVAVVAGEFVVKQLLTHPRPMLVSHHPDYQPIPITPESPLETFGVATHVIRRLL